MNVSIPLILFIFLLGFAAGALLVAVERSARIEKIRRDFQVQLETIVLQTNRDAMTGESKPGVSLPVEKAQSDPFRAA